MTFSSDTINFWTSKIRDTFETLTYIMNFLIQIWRIITQEIFYFIIRKKTEQHRYSSKLVNIYNVVKI